MRRPLSSRCSVSSTSLSSPSPAAGGLFATRLEWLRDGGRAGLIRNGLRGVEKECLRLGADGALSHRPHPQSLGAALTHPYITTDYSEALAELVTPPQRTQWETLQFLCDVHAFIERRLGRRTALAGQHAVRLAAGRRDSDRLLRAVELGSHEDRVSPRPRSPLRSCDASHRRRALQLLFAAAVLAGVSSARSVLPGRSKNFARPSSWGSFATIAASRGSSSICSARRQHSAVPFARMAMSFLPSSTRQRGMRHTRRRCG